MLTVVQLAASEARVSNGARAASSRVSQMLQLRSVVKNIPIVRDAVKGCRSRLLEIVCDVSICLMCLIRYVC